MWKAVLEFIRLKASVNFSASLSLSDECFVGSPEYLTLIPTCASVVNRVFAEFLSRQPKIKIPSTPICVTVAERSARMSRALAKLGSLMNDSSFSSRDLGSSMSFSCVSPEILQNQTDVLRRQMLDERNAFSPLGLDGRPCRRSGFLQCSLTFY